MKKTFAVSSLIAISALLSSCNENSVTEDFNNANGDVVKKYIQSIQYNSEESSAPIEMNYNEDGSLNSVFDGKGTTTFEYEEESLIASKGAMSLSATKFIDTPIDWENVTVDAYDDNGNPTLAHFNDYTSEYVDGDYVDTPYTMTIEFSYDNKPNLFFATLEAAGIIELMDAVDMNLAPDLKNLPQVVKARELMFVNNLKTVKMYSDIETENKFSFNFSYVFEADDYPKSVHVEQVVSNYNNEPIEYFNYSVDLLYKE